MLLEIGAAGALTWVDRSLDSAACFPHSPRQIEMTTTMQTAYEMPDLPVGGFVMPVVCPVEVQVGYRRIVNQTQRQEGPI
jgi:hypothetical protein